MKTVLPFNDMPKGLPFNKKILYCVVDISGIQSYIFHAMDNTTTPAQVCFRSQFVEHLTHYIYEKLSFVPGFLFGSMSSGKILCAFRPSVKESKLQLLLDKLQRNTFASTQGKLTFYYAICSATCIPTHHYQCEKMQHAGNLLGQKLEKEKYHNLNLLQVDMKNDVDENLVPQIPSVSTNIKTDDQVVVKLDLDNLGSFFRGITCFDQRHQVSEALNKTIDQCLTADTRIELIFAGGDDIFFLCPFDEYLSVVSDFYIRLKRQFKETPELIDYADKYFGVSGGLCILRNKLDNIPLISYYESSENALIAAKTTGGKNCLCLQLPGNEILYIKWDDFCFLADVFSRLKEPLFAQHRFTGSDIFNISLLADQLSICGKHNNLLEKKEIKKLYEIKSQSI